MKIFDTFLFGFELDLLEIRLNLLDPYVDYFVFSESTTTLSGVEKELYYKNNKDRFEKFNHKIIYNEIPDPTSEQLNQISQQYNIAEHPSYQRDVYQKNSIKSVLDQYCTDEDIVLWSDLDEVPNPEVLKDLSSFYDPNCVYNFAQDNFQGCLNWFETTGTILSQTPDFEYGAEKPRWIGTKMCSFSILKKYTLTDIRRPLNQENNLRIYPGGWHWSSVGSPEKGTLYDRIMRKIKTSPHVDLNNPELIASLPQRLAEGRSPLGQDNASYSTIELTEENNFPKYLVDNIEQYSYLLK
jgi:beta-1,4-mannosyl-glycoprotein beta-1,4-N-acetylglucosaminyltransferase